MRNLPDNNLTPLLSKTNYGTIAATRPKMVTPTLSLAGIPGSLHPLVVSKSSRDRGTVALIRLNFMIWQDASVSEEVGAIGAASRLGVLVRVLGITSSHRVIHPLEAHFCALYLDHTWSVRLVLVRTTL